MLLLFITQILCTIYFFNLQPSQEFKILSDTKTFIVNSSFLLDNNFTKINKPISEIRTEILNLYAERDKFNKLIFTSYKSIQKYITQNKNESFIVVMGNISDKNTAFKSKEELILLGCKNEIMFDGLFYFCDCSYKRCGIVCEYEKPMVLINIILVGLLMIFLITFVKKEEDNQCFHGVRRRKVKLE